MAMANVPIQEQALQELASLGEGIKIVPANLVPELAGSQTGLQGTEMEPSNVQPVSPTVEVSEELSTPDTRAVESTTQIGSMGTPAPIDISGASMDTPVSPPLMEEPTVDPTQFANLLLAKSTIPEEAEEGTPTDPKVQALRNAANTIPQTNASGLNDFNPVDMPQVVGILGEEFASMSPTGVIFDPMERVAFVTSVMANDSLRSDIKAQLVDQMMRDGKAIPQALPKAWFEARGLTLLPEQVDTRILGG